MKKILFFLCVGLMIGNAQTPTKTQVETTIAADIPDNTIGFVTPAKLRNVANSILNYAATKPPISHTHTTGEISDWVSAYAAQFAAKSTSDLSEGANKYYTDARVQAFGDTRYLQIGGSSVLSGDLVPAVNNVISLGTNAKRYLSVYSNTLNINGDATLSSIVYVPAGAVTLRTPTSGGVGFGFTLSNEPFVNGNFLVNGNLGGQFADTYTIGALNRYRSIGITRQVAVGNYTYTSSSGNDSNILLTANFNTTGTAASNLIYGGGYYQATGSGVQNLINLGEFSAVNGGGVFTSKFSVDKTGLGRFSNALLINKTFSSGENLQVEGTSRLNGNTYIGGVLTLGVSGDLFLDGDKGFSRYVNDLILRPYATGTSGRIVMQSNDYAHTFFHATANGINLGADADVHPSAALQISSTTKGFLPTRLTASEASAIASPAEGLMLYVTNTNATFTAKGWWGFNGTTWEKLNN